MIESSTRRKLQRLNPRIDCFYLLHFLLYHEGMWDCGPQPLYAGAYHYAPRLDGSPVSYREVLRYWQNDEAFGSFFISLLATSPLSGFRWETPPITTATADREFEFVLLDAPGLVRSPDAEAFAEQFQLADPNQRVIGFPNLGNDAVLVVPRPSEPRAAMVHLASFVREAPSAQVHELWQVVGAAMEARLSARATWLSTAGMGVSWLHVRLDSRPKYYGFAPYRSFS